MENKIENILLIHPKKAKAKNCFGPMTFKLLTKNKNFNLNQFFKEKKEKIKSHNTSRNKENNKIGGGIINIKDLLLYHTKKSKNKNSHSSNNSKLKGERNLKKTLIMPYQTFNKTSMNQWKKKYHTKNNSSKIYCTNPEISKNISIPSPHIRQYNKEYNIINFKQKSTIDKSIKKKKINLMNTLQININKNGKVNKTINNKEDNLYYKLENIKLRCHNLLKNFSNHADYLKNEIDKYKNKNCNISLKHSRIYSVS